MTELHYLSAVEALAHFRDRTLSPVELLDAVIARAAAVEPTVNAFSEERFDEARTAAKDAEATYVRRAGDARPLEGIPVALKDEVPVEGWSWSSGCFSLRDEVAPTTAPLADRLFSSGAIVHARTTTPEMSCAPFTHSLLWGVTRNPWNPSFTAGGSSGGSGAAVAAGSATLATGSDIGGSIRIPASVNGLVGYKPPRGRVPGVVPGNLTPYVAHGPLARTVADCALFANVLAGQHPDDLTVVPAGPPITVETLDVRGWRIALAIELGGVTVDPEVAAAIAAVGDRLRDAGAIVEEVDLGWRRADIVDAAFAHFGAVWASGVRPLVDAAPDAFSPYTHSFVDFAVSTLERLGTVQGLMLEAEVQARLAGVLRDHRLLLCPTLAIPAFDAGDDYVDHGIDVGGQVVSLWEACLTIGFNICNPCPVLDVPAGRASNGVPIGVQLVGRPYDDQSVFTAGVVVEQMLPAWTSPNWRPSIGDVT